MLLARSQGAQRLGRRATLTGYSTVYITSPPLLAMEPNSDGLQPNSDGLHTIVMASNLLAMAST